jgi:hypothetical protein
VIRKLVGAGPASECQSVIQQGGAAASLMQPVTIRTYECPDVGVRSAAELTAALRTLSSEHCDPPLLIYLYGESGDIMIFGIGAAYTTIQLVPRSRDVNIRSLGTNPPAPESVPFVFQGELTEVWPDYLIPQADGERAVIEWFERGVLDDAVAWSTSPFPPRPNPQP